MNISNEPAAPKAPGWQPGLSKREHFASLAMQAMISSQYYADFDEQKKNKANEGIAVNAVRHADALIMALEGKIEINPQEEPKDKP